MRHLPFPIFVGWDSREDIAYRVCRHSIEARASVPVEVIPIKQEVLRGQGLYTRTRDPLAATEFTYTRFFVPHLAGYRGWALFCDCDFLFLTDIKRLIDLIDDRYAVMCVQHDHRPPESWKMDGRQQTLYPRKNWSSMVLYNCGHPDNAALTPDLINRQTGAFLHRFPWLEGWCRSPDDGHPDVIHFTRGGPWFDDWKDVEFAALWLAEERAVDALLVAS